MEQLAEFERWLRHQGYAATTIEAYVNYSRRAARSCHELGIMLRRATTDELLAFVATLPSPASWRQARKALVAYYTFTGHKRSPAAQLPTWPQPNGQPRPVPIDAHLRFLATAHTMGGDHELIALLFATTGCRISELQRARWHQFELTGDAPCWWIEGKGSGRRGKKVRWVPLHPAVVPVLHTWRAASRVADYLFPALARSSNPYVSETTLRKRFYEITGIAGFRAVPHQVRHTVATITVDETGDIHATSELLGHASVATTQIYAQVHQRRVQAAVLTLPA